MGLLRSPLLRAPLGLRCPAYAVHLRLMQIDQFNNGRGMVGLFGFAIPPSSCSAAKFATASPPWILDPRAGLHAGGFGRLFVSAGGR